MPESRSNPYEAPTAFETPDNEWSVCDLQLVCTQQVELPKICCLTLATSDLQDRDVKVRCASNASGAVWLLTAGAVWYAGRQIARGDWLGRLLQTPMGVGSAFVVVAVVVATAYLLARFFEPNVSLRVSESTKAASKRSRHAWLRRIVGASTTILGGVLFYLCLAIEASPMMMILGPGVPTTLGVIVDQYFLRQSQFRLQLSAAKTGGGMFVVSGFSPEFLTAISENAEPTTSATGGTKFRERLLRSRKDQK